MDNNSVGIATLGKSEFVDFLSISICALFKTTGTTSLKEVYILIQLLELKFSKIK